MDDPHYTLVCDMREAEDPSEEFQYSAQKEMQPPLPRNHPQFGGGGEYEEDEYDEEWEEQFGVNRRRILSTYLDSFFEGFDERTGRYRMRPWLRRLFPRD